jgi:predicted acyltransferase
MPLLNKAGSETINQDTSVLSGAQSPGSAELKKTIGKGVRLASLDFYRGLVMVLLMFESTELYRYVLNMSEPGSLIHGIAIQFTHYPWHGLHLWDFIQPAFMFIAGTAMAFSLTKQTAIGRSWGEQAKHALRRSWWLFFWGVLDYAVNVKTGTLSFQLWDVLTQMSFTMLLAFLIFRWKPGYQILFSIGLLVLTECLYRFINIPGFDQPFTDQHNFGNYMDLVLMNLINKKGWVAINCIPTAAHTIWGAVAGKWLLTRPDHKSSIRHIILLGLLLMAAGYGLDISGITPIIKRIATSSFTLVTGGWCLLALAFLYYWIDILGHKRFLKFFVIVGMNSIFIYLFFEIVVKYWLRDYVNAIVIGLLTPADIPHNAVLIMAALAIFACEWYVCYWLYRKKIFFKV